MYTSSNKRIPNMNSAITRNGQIDIVHKVDTRNRFLMHVVSPLGAYGGCAIALAAKWPYFDCFVSTSRKKRIFIVQNKDGFYTCCMSLKENTNNRFCRPWKSWKKLRFYKLLHYSPEKTATWSVWDWKGSPCQLCQFHAPNTPTNCLWDVYFD